MKKRASAIQQQHEMSIDIQDVVDDDPTERADDNEPFAPFKQASGDSANDLKDRKPSFEAFAPLVVARAQSEIVTGHDAAKLSQSGPVVATEEQKQQDI